MGVFRHSRRTSSSLIGAILLVALHIFVITCSPERDKIRAGAISNQIVRHYRLEGRDQDLGHGRETSGVLWVRRMVGPGSSPPTCRSKCGRCEPCRAVHVPIHPGRGRVSISMEYYPEAWRCKCGKHPCRGSQTFAQNNAMTLR